MDTDSHRPLVVSADPRITDEVRRVAAATGSVSPTMSRTVCTSQPALSEDRYARIFSICAWSIPLR